LEITRQDQEQFAALFYGKSKENRPARNYEDVMALAAKTRGGALVKQRRSRKSM
jgi:hypothetical protein